MKNIALLFVVLLISFMDGISQDEVFIHTDRDIYQAGEVLKFKAYVLSFSNDQQCNSELLNICLIDQDGGVSCEEKLEITDCQVIDQVELPGSLENGQYTFLAYCEGTDIGLAYTKSILIHETLIPAVMIDIKFDNQVYSTGEEAVFHIKLMSPKGDIMKRLRFQYSVKVNGSQVIEGKGKTDKLGCDEIVIEYPDGGDKSLVSFEVSIERSGNTYRNGVIVPSSNTPVLIRFFPEGGLLIDGHESIIGFTASDVYGKLIDIEGDLIDQYDEVCAHINTSVSGLGSFSMMSDARKPMRLRITSPLWAQSLHKLPKIQSNGVVLKLVSSDNGNINLELINPIEDTYMQLRVEAFHGKEELYNKRMLLTTKKNIVIPVSNTVKGIVRIDIKNGSGEIFAQRCVFVAGNRMSRVFSEGSISVTDKYLSPEWEPGPSLKQVLSLGTELALSPFADVLSDTQNKMSEDLIKTYMFTCIKRPNQDEFSLSQVAQYVSELSIMQFFNDHYMSEDIGFYKFFKTNQSELDKLGLIPQQLSQDERIRRQLDAGKSVLSIIRSIRAYRLVDNQMVFRGSDSFNYQGGAIIVIDGVTKGSDVSEIMNINPFEVESIKVSTTISEVMKYSGMENTAGVVIIETKKAQGASIENALDSQVRFYPTIQWDPHYKKLSESEDDIILPESKIKSKYWKRIVDPLYLK